MTTLNVGQSLKRVKSDPIYPDQPVGCTIRIIAKTWKVYAMITGGIPETLLGKQVIFEDAQIKEFFKDAPTLEYHDPTGISTETGSILVTGFDDDENGNADIVRPNGFMWRTTVGHHHMPSATAERPWKDAAAEYVASTLKNLDDVAGNIANFGLNYRALLVNATWDNSPDVWAGIIGDETREFCTRLRQTIPDLAMQARVVLERPIWIKREDIWLSTNERYPGVIFDTDLVRPSGQWEELLPGDHIESENMQACNHSASYIKERFLTLHNVHGEPVFTKSYQDEQPIAKHSPPRLTNLLSVVTLSTLNRVVSDLQKKPGASLSRARKTMNDLNEKFEFGRV